jgi:hypothetical protein
VKPLIVSEGREEEKDGSKKAMESVKNEKTKN